MKTFLLLALISKCVLNALPIDTPGFSILYPSSLSSSIAEIFIINLPVIRLANESITLEWTRPNTPIDSYTIDLYIQTSYDQRIASGIKDRFFTMSSQKLEGSQFLFKVDGFRGNRIVASAFKNMIYYPFTDQF